MSTREEYTAKIKLQLDEFNTKLDELQAKSKETQADVRVKYEAEMAKLRHQSELAVAKLEELKAAGEDSWERIVAEMEKYATHSSIHSVTSSPKSSRSAAVSDDFGKQKSCRLKSSPVLVAAQTLSATCQSV